MSLLTNLAHSIGFRHLLERRLFAPVRTWRKLTAAASFDQELHRAAHQDAAAYAYTYFLEAAYFQSKRDMYDFVLPRIQQKTGMCLEFGVYKAATLNYFANKTPNSSWQGFDSFEGLPEVWGGGEKGQGAFSLGGKLPAVAKNVALHKGWFDQTLPPFLAVNQGEAAFMHLDADLYSSTITVLKLTNDRLLPGSLLLFDEYFGQIGWRVGEHKALQEWMQTFEREVQCLAYVANGAVLFEVTK
jgi:hypothetical protein